ncbi:MAG: hypothetical protein R3C49_19360 [Planctomycetaceae bacterium]
MTHVIAICGTMGSGKSTAIARLQSRLPNCETLFEDDFNPAPLKSLDEVQEWFEAGGRVSEFDLSALVQQLRAATSAGRAIVLLETQFGRMHPALRPLIDLQCWIDVEPDLALARKVTQLARQFAGDAESRSADAAEALLWLAEFCDGYSQITRKLFLQQRTSVGRQSDIQISGHASPDDVCDRICRSLPSWMADAA